MLLENGVRHFSVSFQVKCTPDHIQVLLTASNLQQDPARCFWRTVSSIGSSAEVGIAFQFLLLSHHLMAFSLFSSSRAGNVQRTGHGLAPAILLMDLNGESVTKIDLAPDTTTALSSVGFARLVDIRRVVCIHLQTRY